MTPAIAINFIDLNRHPSFIVGLLLGDYRTGELVHPTTDRLDEAAMVMKGDLVSCAALCDTIRTKDRSLKQYPNRVYLSRSGTSWQPFGHQGTLTDVVDGEVVLSAKACEMLGVGQAEYVPPAPVALRKGHKLL